MQEWPRHIIVRDDDYKERKKKRDLFSDVRAHVSVYDYTIRVEVIFKCCYFNTTLYFECYAPHN